MFLKIYLTSECGDIMKLALIVPSNLKYVPYVKYYIDILKENKQPFDLLVWNKKGLETEKADMIFNYTTSDSNRWKMLFGYFRFIKKCKKYIKDNRIDHLIIFTIAPAFFLGPWYLQDFKNRFILDIRDDSPFRKKFPGVLRYICDLANSVVVSSNEFSNWISRKTVLCHNVDSAFLQKYKDSNVITNDKNTKTKTPINIVFAGMMIEEKINIDVIEKLKNNSLFRLIYIGRSNECKERIVSYVKNNNINNVEFEGEYNKEDIVSIYRKKANLVNILREKTEVNKNAMPNKFYDAVVAGVPIIVYAHNKAIKGYVEKYSLGIVLNENDMSNLPERLSVEFNNFNYDMYQAGRSKIIRQLILEMEFFRSNVIRFIKDI